MKNNNRSLSLLITKNGVRWVTDEFPSPPDTAPTLALPDTDLPISIPDPAPPRSAGKSDRPRPSRFWTVSVIVIVCLAALAAAWQFFVGDLSGYTRENMIPPPPDRTVSASAGANMSP